mmetsp:Transcript_3574/g.14881  ORF Transcript_3574/g.14881 Transcript_3574/m.14881 type:complete len:468 (+) Transcript_3574:519-1922(+)
MTATEASSRSRRGPCSARRVTSSAAASASRVSIRSCLRPRRRSSSSACAWSSRVSPPLSRRSATECDRDRLASHHKNTSTPATDTSSAPSSPAMVRHASRASGASRSATKSTAAAACPRYTEPSTTLAQTSHAPPRQPQQPARRLATRMALRADASSAEMVTTPSATDDAPEPRLAGTPRPAPEPPAWPSALSWRLRFKGVRRLAAADRNTRCPTLAAARATAAARRTHSSASPPITATPRPSKHSVRGVRPESCPGYPSADTANTAAAPTSASPHHSVKYEAIRTAVVAEPGGPWRKGENLTMISACSLVSSTTSFVLRARATTRSAARRPLVGCLPPGTDHRRPIQLVRGPWGRAAPPRPAGCATAPPRPRPPGDAAGALGALATTGEAARSWSLTSNAAPMEAPVAADCTMGLNSTLPSLLDTEPPPSESTPLAPRTSSNAAATMASGPAPPPPPPWSARSSSG